MFFWQIPGRKEGNRESGILYQVGIDFGLITGWMIGASNSGRN
jgi:hypothetical protein